MPLHRICWILIATASLSLAADNFKPETGFVSLFNGRGLTGWCYSADDKFDGKTAASDSRYTAKDGVLTVRIAKRAEDRPRKIAVQ